MLCGAFLILFLSSLNGFFSSSYCDFTNQTHCLVTRNGTRIVWLLILQCITSRVLLYIFCVCCAGAGADGECLWVGRSATKLFSCSCLLCSHKRIKLNRDAVLWGRNSGWENENKKKTTFDKKKSSIMGTVKVWKMKLKKKAKLWRESTQSAWSEGSR